MVGEHVWWFVSEAVKGYDMKKVQVELIETFRKFFDIEVEDDADVCAIEARAEELASGNVIGATDNPDDFERKIEVLVEGVV